MSSAETSSGNLDEQKRSPGISRQQLLSGGTPMNDPLIGKELADRYLISEFLGTGAMGVVYKARHKALDRIVAVKILKAEVGEDAVSRRRFETEAKAAGSLNHPNLIAVHDCGFTDQGMPFLVMDYLEGESLAGVLKHEKHLEPVRLLRILKQICAGLDYAHKKGLVHRDLKPNNIMLLEYAAGRDLVKIVDFGIVKAMGADQDLTQTGQIFGTPHYMSPEQCQGQKLDGRSDIYGLGCIVYRILAGKPPFCGETPVNTIVMHVKEPPPAFKPIMLDNDVVRSLAPLVFKMLEKDPAARFQTADELRIELERIESEATTASMTPYPPLAKPPAEVIERSGQHVAISVPPRDRRVLLATIFGGLIAFMAIVAVVGALLMSQHSAVNQNAVLGPPPEPPPEPTPGATPGPAPEATPVVDGANAGASPPARVHHRHAAESTATAAQSHPFLSKLKALKRFLH